MKIACPKFHLQQISLIQSLNNQNHHQLSRTKELDLYAHDWSKYSRRDPKSSITVGGVNIVVWYIYCCAGIR